MGFWSRVTKQQPPQAEQADDAAEFNHGAAPERYCRSDMIRYPLGEHFQIAYSKLQRVPRVFTPNTLHLLDYCSTFKTLDEHAHDYHELIGSPPGGVEPIKGQLLEFVRDKLLIPYGGLLDLCRQLPARPPSSDKIESIGVVTRDRVASLQRCLASYMEVSRRHGRRPNFIVADDSGDVEAGNAVRQTLGQLKTSFGVEVAYGGFEEKRRFAEALVKGGDLPPEVVEFALFDTERCGISIGANRNALLLHTAGEMVLSADDDTVCRHAAPPKVNEGLAFDSRGEIMQFWFFPDRAEALRTVPPIDEDVLGVHEQLLGRSLADCVSALAVDPEALFERIDSRQVRDIQSGRGKVLVTLPGILGDSAMPAPASNLILRGESRERLTQSMSGYLSAFKSRDIMRVADRPYVSANAWCVTTAVALDNRDLLPPFMPVLRGEDDIFGFTLNACFDKGYFGYLPRAILHDPAEHRSYTPDSLARFASNVRMCNLMLACITPFSVWPGMASDEERLQSLGKHLMEVGAMGGHDFAEYVRVHLLRMASDNISFLERYLQECEGLVDFGSDEAGDYLTRDVGEYVDKMRGALAREDYIVPQDLLDGRGDEEARKLAQRLVLKFGQLLYWWPAVIAAAKGLRSNGQRLASTI